MPECDDPVIVALVERVKSERDPDAFSELYTLFAARIRSYLYHKTHNVADADDITAIVFTKTWEQIGSFEWRDRAFISWLYALARNAYFDMVRSPASRPTKSLTVAATESHSDYEIEIASPTALAQFDRAIDSQYLWQALAVLTSEQRDVLVMRFLDDMEYDEIAAIMNRHEGAIRALQMRGLRSLRRIIAKLSDP